MQVVSETQLKDNIKNYFDDVAISSDIIFVSRDTEDDAVVIISLKEYNSIIETEYLLSTNANRQKLYSSIDQLNRAEIRKINV